MSKVKVLENIVENSVENDVFIPDTCILMGNLFSICKNSSAESINFSKRYFSQILPDFFDSSSFLVLNSVYLEMQNRLNISKEKYFSSELIGVFDSFEVFLELIYQNYLVDCDENVLSLRDDLFSKINGRKNKKPSIQDVEQVAFGVVYALNNLNLNVYNLSSDKDVLRSFDRLNWRGGHKFVSEKPQNYGLKFFDGSDVGFKELKFVK